MLHAPANFGPMSGPFARVLTLHDVLFRRQADLLTPAVRWATGAMIVPAVRRADRVITGSAASRTDIAAALGVAPERFDVVPHGFTPPSGAPNLEAARERLGGSGRPVALAVATHLPHKNLRVLLDALRSSSPHNDRSWWSPDTARTLVSSPPAPSSSV